VGVVLDGAEPREVEDILSHYQDAQVRVLNPAHGMYEVFGVSLSQAQTLTQARVSQNVFFTSAQRLKPQSETAPDGMQVPGFNKCRGGKSDAEVKLTSVSPKDLDGATIELGDNVQVHGEVSKAVRSAILVAGPDASLHPRVMLKNGQFTPDTLGLYRMFIFAQDSNDVCVADTLHFIVTANRPYKGPNAPALKVDLKRFTHLATVSAPQAWQISEGEGIQIAIIDTGVDYNHPSLAPQIQLNENEIAGNHLDDDANGFVDDVLGYDLVNGDEFPYDDDSHGTHVAGLAAARDIGLARKAKIVPIKGLTSIGGDAGTIAAAMRYAVDRKVQIINMSLGAAAPVAHPALVSAMNYAEEKGVLVVVAAGNGDPDTGLGMDIDQVPSFPASLPNDNIISVAAFDGSKALSLYSNFGKVGVDVVAPGGDDGDLVYSCAYENVRNTAFVGMSGTSMATPIVAGIAADVMAHNPKLSLQQVKDILLSAGSSVDELKDITVSGRHIDALSALQQSAGITDALF
jgi:subtilisin family serine protease